MSKSLNERQLKAIELIADGQRTVRQICDEVGIGSRTTFYDWMKKDEFKKKLQETLEQKGEIMKESLKGRVDDYISTLETIRKKSKNDMARYHSANVLLNHAGWIMNTKQEVTVKDKDEEDSKNYLMDMIKNKDDEDSEGKVH
jgi:transposase-like protein